MLELLLVYLDQSGDHRPPAEQQARVRRMLLHTLDALAMGGIRDQLGGGFHRYSTDAEWLVPHFEIMLYDNAMLAWCYAEAYRQTREPRYAEVARGVLDFVMREMTSPAGAFYTAFDAEVDAKEGEPYLWTKGEVEAVLKDLPAKPGDSLSPADLFNRVYGVDRGPNFADPHHGNGTPDKSILYLPKPMEAVAADLKIDPAVLASRLAEMREKLYAERRNRKQPLLDTKILTSWNGLMIRAFAHGGQVLGEKKYLDAATRGAEFVLRNHLLSDGALLRTSGGGLVSQKEASQALAPSPSILGEGGGEGSPTQNRREDALPDPLPEYREREKSFSPPEVTGSPSARPIPGFLDDYAFLSQALLALDQAGIPGSYKSKAQELAQQCLDRFGDAQFGGFYFTDRSATDLIVRQKTASDSPLPSGNAVAAMVLLELGQVATARQTIAAFAQQVADHGEGMSSMVQAALQFLRRAEPFVVSAAEDAAGHERPPAPKQTADTIVAATARWQSETELKVQLSIRAGFHINAHDVGGAPIPLIPTVLRIADSTDASIEYPPAQEQQFEFSEVPMKVYAGDVTVAVKFRVPRRAGAALQLTLAYQACSDSACLPPTTVAVRVEE